MSTFGIARRMLGLAGIMWAIVTGIGVLRGAPLLTAVLAGLVVAIVFIAGLVLIVRGALGSKPPQDEG
jgi:hypothetical protein